jgi:hypothetical protein
VVLRRAVALGFRCAIVRLLWGVTRFVGSLVIGGLRSSERRIVGGGRRHAW